MDWVQYFALLLPLVGFFAFLYKELKDWRSETRQEITEIRKEGRETRNEIRKEVKEAREEAKEAREEAQRSLELQATRSDRLYEMFYDLIKEIRKQ